MNAVQSYEPSAEAVPLSPEGIERTLRELWQNLAEQDATVMQVRTLNMLGYLPPDAGTLGQLIAGVAAEHPGRTVVLAPDDGPPRAEPTVVCRVGGSAYACGEQVILRGGAKGEALHSLALALLQPGLPTLLWWYGDPPFERHPFEPLADAADHVVLDSRSWSNLVGSLTQLVAVRQQQLHRVRYSDLQWSELTPWRQFIAQAFDSPATQALLPKITSGSIRYAGREHLGGALLLAGWIGNALGWDIGSSVARRNGKQIDLTLSTTKRVLALEERPAEEGLQGLVEVQLVAGTDPPARFTWRSEPQKQHVATMIELPALPPLQRLTQCRPQATAALIATELAMPWIDTVYGAALHTAMLLCQQIEGL